MMKMLHAIVSHDMISPINNIKFFAEEMKTACLERELNDVEKYH
jgi:light-regulated signal transduction histidine kinase (bacteriophytochrome)